MWWGKNRKWPLGELVGGPVDVSVGGPDGWLDGEPCGRPIGGPDGGRAWPFCEVGIGLEGWAMLS